MNWKKTLIYDIFILSLVGTIGSLYFSEVRHFAPCILCWYQRIALYPIVAISAVGIWFDDKKFYRYALPCSIIGIVIAIYHNLLYINVIPEAVAPCTFGVSCTSKYISWFGFVSIPLLSLVTFAFITVALVIIKKDHAKA